MADAIHHDLDEVSLKRVAGPIFIVALVAGALLAGVLFDALEIAPGGGTIGVFAFVLFKFGIGLAVGALVMIVPAGVLADALACGLRFSPAHALRARRPALAHGILARAIPGLFRPPRFVA